MAKVLTHHVLLSEDEYEELTNPDVCYTYMTKTLAKKLVSKLLKHETFVCYHDRKPVPHRHDMWCYAECPLMQIFGDEIGDRLCTKDKMVPK